MRRRAVLPCSPGRAPGCCGRTSRDPAVLRRAQGSTDAVQDPSCFPIRHAGRRPSRHADPVPPLRPPEGGPAGGADRTAVKGCTWGAAFSDLKHFMLHLPPGMLGNPTEVIALPDALFLAGVVPAGQPGRLLADRRRPGPEAATAGPLLDVPTPIYNVATLGLEPARLGTEAPLPTDPPGPLPIVVTLRTADSTNPVQPARPTSASTRRSTISRSSSVSSEPRRPSSTPCSAARRPAPVASIPGARPVTGSRRCREPCRSSAIPRRATGRRR